MLKSFLEHHPRLGPGVFIEESAQVVGEVEIGRDSSVWFHAVVRGDVSRITIGEASNVQDLCVLHGFKGKHDVVIGNRVSLGHAAVVHGAHVEDRCLIGIGAIVLNGARIGAGSIVAAGALVPEGMVVEPGSVMMGVPARRVRQVTEAERALIETHADNYLGYKEQYLSQR